jgi:hypothetical protein
MRIVAEAVRTSGVLVAPHNASGPAATAATDQATSALSVGMLLEYAWGE